MTIFDLDQFPSEKSNTNPQSDIDEINSLYLQLIDNLDSARIALVNHPVYQRLNSRASLQLFMESHVFAVWDGVLHLMEVQHVR
ncbi:MAG: DUF3050 domain-containing protein [Gloeotrichia echinulata GP01]